MTARLVIHSEITTAEELFETIRLFIDKSADNPFELEKLNQYFASMANTMILHAQRNATEQEKENARA